MDPRYGSQDGRQYGEASSYYQQPNAQYPYSGGPDGHQGYGPPAGDRYDERQQHHPSYQNDGYQSTPQNGGPGEEGDRGLMGALAGGAAGAYGGHKMGHGVIGALGGAFAGHKLEDFAHDRKEKKEEEKLQHQMHSPPPSYSPGPDHSSHHHHHGEHHSSDRDRSLGHHAGNFSASSHDIHLEGDFDLIATCQRREGGSHVSTLNLNGVITNEDGHFRWASGSGAGSMTVQPGDTLREIARRFNCGFEEIATRNNISNPDMIYPGQILQIPGQTVGNFSSSARDIRLVDGGRVLEAELRNTRGDWNRSRIELDERIGNADGNLRFV
ncbi:carbohydrate-binding module family 50 protein [Hypoxylon fuscum]|nr:carbohydrate-binding module family 50 protein [Hypoxylon fuscum]